MVILILCYISGTNTFTENFNKSNVLSFTLAYIMKILLFSFFFLTINATAQTGFNPTYKFLHSGNLVADKDFYLLTVIDHSPEIKKLMMKDTVLQTIRMQLLDLIRQHVNDTCKTVAALLTGFRWTNTDSISIDQAIRNLYTEDPKSFDRIIDQHLRPSGYYERFIKLSNEELFLKAWGQYVKGINYIIDQYGLGKKMRYPDVDSVSYNVKAGYYQDLIKTIFSYLDETEKNSTLFYKPSLSIAILLMQINERDEPARYEPLETGGNKKAIQKAKQTAWSKYPYTAILVPGEGPDLTTVSIAPAGRMRCDLAAERYKKGLAPFIIVSGGHVHPFHTPYCEAVEMKKYLINNLGIPEEAIIIEPQARHTTTNFRNAERLMIRYGFPLNRLALCITTKDQEDYIDNPHFDLRNNKELGYLPYRDKKRISNHELSFYPVIESLHMDPYDPLDP